MHTMIKQLVSDSSVTFLEFSGWNCIGILCRYGYLLHCIQAWVQVPFKVLK